MLVKIYYFVPLYLHFSRLIFSGGVARHITTETNLKCKEDVKQVGNLTRSSTRNKQQKNELIRCFVGKQFFREPVVDFFVQLTESVILLSFYRWLSRIIP